MQRKDSVEIDCSIINTSQFESLLALYTCATRSAVHLSALIARPCLTVVDTECLAPAGYVGLGNVGVWSDNLQSVVCSFLNSLAHGINKTPPAGGTDGRIAGVMRYIYSKKPMRLGESCRY